MNDKYQVTEAEYAIISKIRRMRLFDVLEVKFSKQGELMWQTTKVDRGKLDYQSLTDQF